MDFHFGLSTMTRDLRNVESGGNRIGYVIARLLSPLYPSSAHAKADPWQKFPIPVSVSLAMYILDSDTHPDNLLNSANSITSQAYGGSYQHVL